MPEYRPNPDQLDVAPGWYPDPTSADVVRWWDGTAWSSHTAPRVHDKEASRTLHASQASVPADWYPDSTPPGVVRWWNGTAWTSHTASTPLVTSTTVAPASHVPVTGPAANWAAPTPQFDIDVRSVVPVTRDRTSWATVFVVLLWVACIGEVLYVILEWNRTGHIPKSAQTAAGRMAVFASLQGLGVLINKAAFKKAKTLRSLGVAPDDMPRWVRECTNPQARRSPATRFRWWRNLAFVVAMLLLLPLLVAVFAYAST